MIIDTKDKANPMTISFSRIITIAMLVVFAGMFLGNIDAHASGGETKKLSHEHWHFNGIFGTYDKEAVQRGFQVYSEVCSNCHGVEQLSFRNLGQKGGPFYLNECPPGSGISESVDCSNPNDNPYVKQIAQEYKFEVTDGPDEGGDMFQRQPKPSDRIPGPYANSNQARAANNGALPPDLSLITKARHHGPDYVFSLLQGYKEPPETVNLATGQYYNEYYPGDMSLLIKEEYRDENGEIDHSIEIPKGGAFAMAPPLSDGIVDYADVAIPETTEQYARDVTEFLMWAAEPKLEARKNLGFMSVIYLLILSGLLYWSSREIWSKAH